MLVVEYFVIFNAILFIYEIQSLYMVFVNIEIIILLY